jgi:hypothetical protein
LKRINVLEKSFPNHTEAIAHPSNPENNHKVHIAIKRSLKQGKPAKYKVNYKPRQKKKRRKEKYNRLYSDKTNRVKHVTASRSIDKYLKQQQDSVTPARSISSLYTRLASGAVSGVSPRALRYA